MKVFNDVITASRSFDCDGDARFTFGSLQDMGVLDKDYRAAAGWSEDCDMGFDIVWTVLEDVSINGEVYAKGAKIEWCK